MSQLPLFEPPSWTVTDLTRYLRELLEGDPSLGDLWVMGEVSNLSKPSSGHLYFTLKDAQASLRCVMWRNLTLHQAYQPREGEAIEVHGAISIYEASGQYQLYADWIRPAGEGVLYQEFLRLKARLEGEGLFAPERKRAIPKWPQRIGIVTSPTGAAIRDMLNTLRRRYPLVEVIIAPTPVQGDEAPAGIVAALESLNRLAKPDVILLGRGGGSIEDLWAFNDERVVRAVVASQAPVITGIGHETDFTIVDFAADMRAATPTAAAEMATPNRADLAMSLAEINQRLVRTMQSRLNVDRWKLGELANALRFHSPLVQVRSDRQRIDELSHRAGIALRHRFQFARANLQGFKLRLLSLNPTSVLERGFAIVSHVDGRLVRSVKQVDSGESLNVRVSDGSFDVKVSGQE